MKRIISMTRGYWLGLIAALLVTTSAGAQDLMLPPGLEDAFNAGFLRRDLQMLTRDLALDQEQTAIVQTLFADYESAFRAGADAVRKELGKIAPLLGQEDPLVTEKREELRRQLSAIMEEIRVAKDSGEQEVSKAALEKVQKVREDLLKLQQGETSVEQLRASLNEVEARLDAWRTERTALRDEFIASLMAVLNEDQQVRWPAVERTIVRERALPHGRLSGEMTDLFQVIAELDLPPQAAELIAEDLSDYELKLDAALRKRDLAIETGHRALLEAVRASDEKALTELLARQTQHRVAIREVNEAAAQSIAAKLTPETARVFSDTYRLRAYGRIFRSTKMQRMFKSAREIEGLSAETNQAIAGLEEAYLAELKTINDQLLITLRKQEPQDLAERLALRWRPGKSPSQEPAAESPLEMQFQRRGDLDQRFAKQLESLLAPEQWQQLAKGGGN